MRNGATRLFGIGLVLSVFALAACEDDPVDIREEHGEEIGGFTLLSGTTLRVDFVQGETPETLVLTQGIDREVSILWRDADGEIVTVDDAEGFSWDIQSNDETVVTFQDDPSLDPWDGVLSAGAAGSTTITVRLLHGGHADFTGVVPVQVE